MGECSTLLSPTLFCLSGKKEKEEEVFLESVTMSFNMYTKIATSLEWPRERKRCTFLNSNAILKVSFSVSEIQTMIAGNNDSTSGLAVIHEAVSLWVGEWGVQKT